MISPLPTPGKQQLSYSCVPGVLIGDFSSKCKADTGELPALFCWPMQVGQLPCLSISDETLSCYTGIEIFLEVFMANSALLHATCTSNMHFARSYLVSEASPKEQK